jgi:alpha-galactosidase
MRVDLEIPEKYGIYQSVGDTTGPGGISRALRNIPVVVEIARKMEKFCPNAFLFNYTNPLTTLTRAITRETRIKTAGFCHELFSTQGMLLNEVFQVEHSTELEIKAGGINHFLWIVELKIRGQDGFPILQKYAENYRQPPLPPDATPATRSLKQHDFRVVKFELFKKFGYFPAGGDRHLAEFLPYFLNPEADYGKKYKVALTTIEDRIKWLESDKKRVWETIKGEREIEIKVSQEAVTPIMVAMLEKREEVHILNLPNRGQIANFPHGAVVETMGVIGPSRLEGLAIGNFPAVLHGLLLNHIIKQEITVEAALRGDKKLALEAMLLDPLVRDFYSVEKMLDEMLLANKKFLPRFFE